MKIAILSRNEDLYSTRRLREAAEAKGHEVEIVDYLRCYMNITSQRPSIHYKGKELGLFDAIIPRIGAKRAIFVAIAVYLFVTIWAPFMESNTEFYFLAIIVGLVQGGIQALSRSFYAKIIPVEKSAEYFGFYNMIGKFSTVIGPVFMGGVGLLMRQAGYSSNIASRISIVSVSLFFLAGGILLFFVNQERGKQELKYLSRGSN